MRRKDREITDYNKMLHIISECDCCHLGLIDEKGAYILPLNYGYEDKNGRLILYFHGATQGKKIDLIREQSTASFEMDRKHELVKADIACDYSYLFQSIMGNGKICIVENYEEKVHGLQILMSHYSTNHNWEFSQEQVNAITVIKLDVTNWSCKEH